MKLKDFSSKPVTSTFIVPQRHHTNMDFELGGLAVQDGSLGLTYQLWSSVYSDGRIILRPKEGAPYLFDSGACIEHSFTFDQNMNTCIVWNSDASKPTKLNWYDPLIGDQVTWDLPAHYDNPYVVLDDHREFRRGDSDILLVYIYQGKLRYRLQRERYLQEHIISDALNRKLTQAGMTRNYRFRFRTVFQNKGE